MPIFHLRRKNRIKGRIRGTTMVEMMVVVTIFSIIAVSVATALVSGVKLWNRAKGVDSFRNEFLLDMETLAKDLRGMVEIPAIGCEGKDKEVVFAAINGNRVVKISYLFDPAAKALLRKEAEFKAAVDENIKEGIVEKRLPRWEEFEASYLYRDAESKTYEWTNEWTKEKGIFCAVKIKARFKDEEFVKTIFIPIAQFG